MFRFCLFSLVEIKIYLKWDFFNKRSGEAVSLLYADESNSELLNKSLNYLLLVRNYGHLLKAPRQIFLRCPSEENAKSNKRRCYKKVIFD